MDGRHFMINQINRRNEIILSYIHLFSRIPFRNDSKGACPGIPTECTGRGTCNGTECTCNSPWTFSDCTDLLPQFVNTSNTGLSFGGLAVKVGFYIKDVDYFGVTRNFFTLSLDTMTLLSNSSSSNYTESLYSATIVSTTTPINTGLVQVAVRKYTQDTVVFTARGTTENYVISKNTVSYVLSFSGYQTLSSTNYFRVNVFAMIDSGVAISNPISSYDIESGSIYSYKWANMTPVTTTTNGASLTFRAISIGVTGNDPLSQYSPTLFDYSPSSSQAPSTSFVYARYIYSVKEDVNSSISFDFSIIGSGSSSTTTDSTSATTTTSTTTDSTSTTSTTTGSSTNSTGSTTTSTTTGSTTTTNGKDPSTSSHLNPFTPVLFILSFIVSLLII
ncbi:hypothetical protein DFA_11804 [Cavenderia fasciculata]|uniref:EGF-like domain-containing protein n=1 Tax=Cavenderia fasciculata TaxID=261658 RepID=F4QE94_CACFS|nr:uncharacterized protein DFA_11804 [Cavenderia fasciculata]EGG14041.1 hypothetical protein DFA_11804 [Cavenderia fasciculata]|eukprot:XP_004350749.1 hypothetical protein DFA_11804 [Cavenderia fasciculata]